MGRLLAAIKDATRTADIVDAAVVVSAVWAVTLVLASDPVIL
jgi:hypothetical protein